MLPRQSEAPISSVLIARRECPNWDRMSGASCSNFMKAFRVQRWGLRFFFDDAQRRKMAVNRPVGDNASQVKTRSTAQAAGPRRSKTSGEFMARNNFLPNG